MSKIILTGFEPFGPYAFNPVEESTRHFDAQTIGSSHVVGIVLRCTYRGAFETLQKAIRDIQLTAIVSTGLASSVQGIRFETIGQNIMDGKYPDADGYEPKGVKIDEKGADFAASTARNVSLAYKVHGKGIPTEISRNADSFICNALLYQTSSLIHRERLRMRNVFIHVPWTENFKDDVTLEAGKIMLPQEALFEAIEEIIKGISDE